MSANPVAYEFLAFAVKRMRMSEKEIMACVDRLTEEQAWHRGGDHENSVANLVLHLAGNLRQWILHGIAGQPDVRERDGEFSLVPTMSLAEARGIFVAAVNEACEVIAGLAPERLLERIDPQPNGTWRHLPVLDAIFQVVGHIQQHHGQIVLLTKQLTGLDLDLTMPRKR